MALQQGHEKVVSVLLEYDSRGTSRVQLTALHIAAKKDDVKAAALLLQNERAQFINDDTTQVRYHCLSNAIHCMGQNIKSLAACVCVCVRTGLWGRISRKRLEIETWYQWSTNRKRLVGNRLVT